MALLGNASLLHKSPAKYVTGTVGFCDRANWNKPGMMRSRGDLTLSAFWKYDAVPSGMVAGRAFLAPQKAGRMVTRSAFKVDGQAMGAMGRPGAAVAGFAIGGASVGGLIAGGVAACTFTIGAGASIAGLAAGRAAGAIGVDAGAVAGATAWGVAAGAFGVQGGATAFARGHMRASTVDNTTLTPLSIAQAVWRAVGGDYIEPGSMGAKLNGAASGGVDYAALGLAVWQSASRTLTAGGTAPSTAEIATEVLAAMNATPPGVNMVQVKGQAIGGAGTEADPWGPAS